jgi:hypothetical protein
MASSNNFSDDFISVDMIEPQSNIVATYDYTNETGRLLFQIVRYKPKGFRTRQPRKQGGWRWKIRGVPHVLYRLADVMKADTILILEGEKDVETAIQLGLPDGWAATTSPFGSCRWLTSYSEVLCGKRAIICPDTDFYGRQHLMQVGLSLVGKAAAISVVHLPESVKDLTEWVERGGSREAFISLLQQAVVFDYPRSDELFRDNVRPLEGSLDRLIQLQGVTYEWKEPETQGNLMGTQIGLISQSIEAVFPEWVGIDANGYQTLSIFGFEALSIEAIKELNGEKLAVEARLQSLMTKIAALEEKLQLPTPN